MNRLRAWYHRNILAPDPSPSLSRLDRADGLDLASEVLRRQREHVDGRQR